MLQRLGIAFFLLFSNIYGQITKIHSLESIRAQLEMLNENDLLIFDVDETLLMPKDMLLRPCGKRCLMGLIATYTSKTDPKQQEYLTSQVLLQREAQPVEEQAPKLIQKLQDKGIKVFALTAMRPGPLGAIPSMEKWRVSELKRLGYDFSTTFPNHPHLEFPGKKYPVIFEKGVLSSADTPKGVALVAFINKLQLKPARVFFIDNRHSHLESVEKELDKTGITHCGYYYLAAYDIPGELEEEVAEWQIRTLIEKETWLSDSEAKRQLEENLVSNPQ